MTNDELRTNLAGLSLGQLKHLDDQLTRYLSSLPNHARQGRDSSYVRELESRSTLLGEVIAELQATHSVLTADLPTPTTIPPFALKETK